MTVQSFKWDKYHKSKWMELTLRKVKGFHFNFHSFPGMTRAISPIS